LQSRFFVKARWPGRLGAWKARQQCLQLASIYWSLFANTARFCFDKADGHYRADRTLLTIQGPVVCPVSIVSMACRQRLCCGLLRSAGATSPFSIRPTRATFTWKSTYSLPQKSSFCTTPFQYAEIIIKVPPMAESISEGTLSTISKQPGDHVEQDEEIASIETDKVMRQHTAY
jgi:hypothetical protein